MLPTYGPRACAQLAELLDKLRSDARARWPECKHDGLPDSDSRFEFTRVIADAATDQNDSRGNTASSQKILLMCGLDTLAEQILCSDFHGIPLAFQQLARRARAR